MKVTVRVSQRLALLPLLVCTALAGCSSSPADVTTPTVSEQGQRSSALGEALLRGKVTHTGDECLVVAPQDGHGNVVVSWRNALESQRDGDVVTVKDGNGNSRQIGVGSSVEFGGRYVNQTTSCSTVSSAESFTVDSLG